MANIEELKAQRIAKLNALKDAGLDPYPAHTGRSISNLDFLNNFSSDLNKQDADIVFTLAGRVMNMRSFGALTFARLDDGTQVLQLVVEEEHSKESAEYLKKYVDIGDFIEVSGVEYITKKGEKSLLVKSVKMLSKSLLPLPDKWDGLQDEESRMRLRYLDILTNPELKDLFIKKAKFWQVTRRFLEDKNFLHVDTPTIETTTGGAEAEPFKTFHNDYDLDVYMRICVGELWQKRLMAAGFPKTFEIGRAYRNEGSSPDHLQEFTNMEFYWAYADYRDGMKLVKDMYIEIAREVFGTTEFTSRGHTFNLANEWKEINYVEEIKSQTGIDVEVSSDEEIKNRLKELSVKYDGITRERLVDSIWKYCRKNIAGPAFLVNHPSIVGPLAKSNSDGKTVQMFNPIFAGLEVGRGYSELNDPLDQRARFEEQQKLLDRGDKEAMMPDWEFVEMLEHGMPPTCGFGFGERMFAVLANIPLREATLFPLVKPK